MRISHVVTAGAALFSALFVIPTLWAFPKTVGECRAIGAAPSVFDDVNRAWGERFIEADDFDFSRVVDDDFEPPADAVIVTDDYDISLTRTVDDIDIDVSCQLSARAIDALNAQAAAVAADSRRLERGVSAVAEQASVAVGNARALLDSLKASQAANLAVIRPLEGAAGPDGQPLSPRSLETFRASLKVSHFLTDRFAAGHQRAQRVADLAAQVERMTLELQVATAGLAEDGTAYRAAAREFSKSAGQVRAEAAPAAVGGTTR